MADQIIKNRNLSSQFQNEPQRVPGPSVNICYRSKSRKGNLGWLGIGKLEEVEQVVKGRHQPSTVLPTDLLKRSPLLSERWRGEAGRVWEG